jgi:hypothetical protein
VKSSSISSEVYIFYPSGIRDVTEPYSLIWDEILELPCY